ncbi:MAG: serine/threonine protein kinase [Anaerolineae bacterium]|nr:serine/threonine protein kinase [Anaerolineae bacterium]
MSRQNSPDQLDTPGGPTPAGCFDYWLHETDVNCLSHLPASDRIKAAHALNGASITAFFTGHYTDAERCSREANTIYAKLNCQTGIAQSSAILSALTFLRGEFATARTLLAQALAIVTETGDGQMRQSWPFRCNIQIVLNKLCEHTTNKSLDENTHRCGEKADCVAKTNIPTRIDRFRIKWQLGAGDLVTVYLAYDPDSGRDVALRLVNPAYIDLEAETRSAELSVKLAHPAIPECYGYYETPRYTYTVVEFIDGQDLETMLWQHKGFLAEQDVIEWAVQICGALAYLHRQEPHPLIFRDMKPSSVMVDRHGKVHLTDFNLMEPCQAGREQACFGTVGYTPPEQYLGYADARSDVFALGATLHYLLTRRDPRQERPFSFHDAPPRSLNPAISVTLGNVILKAVEQHPEDRYQSVNEMRAALLACP